MTRLRRSQINHVTGQIIVPITRRVTTWRGSAALALTGCCANTWSQVIVVVGYHMPRLRR